MSSAEDDALMAAAFSASQPADDCKQLCSKAPAAEPCDVKSLSVEDSSTGRKVACVWRRSFSPRRGAGSYDLTLECVADYEKNTNEQPKKRVQLTVVGEPLGECSKGVHPSFALVPKHADASDLKVWSASQHAPIQLLAWSEVRLGYTGSWLNPFWPAKRQKEYTVNVESCGVRKEGAVNKDLTCLVRVYPDDKYELTLTIPAVRSYKGERSASIDLDGTIERKKSFSSEEFGEEVSNSTQKQIVNRQDGTDYVSSEVTGKDLNGGLTTLKEERGRKDKRDHYLEEEKRVLYDEGLLARQKHTITQSDSINDSAKLLFEKGPTEIKPALSLKRNGQEVGITSALNHLLDITKKLREAWNSLVNFVPKIGWSASFDIALLQGTITGEWGVRELPVQEGGRDALVETYYSIRFDVELYNLTLKATIGVEIKSAGVFDAFFGRKLLEIIIQVEATVTSKVTLKNLLIDSKAGAGEEALTAESDLDIKAHGRVTIYGYTYDGQAGVRGGITFEGKLVWGADAPPHATCDLKFKETVLYATFYDGVEGRYSDRYEKEVFKEYPLWKGKLPG